MKESLASINTSITAQNKRRWEFAPWFTWYYFCKQKRKRRDRSGTNRKRGKTKEGKREGSIEVSATSSAVQGHL